MKRIEMIGTPLDHVATPGLLNPLFRASGDPLEVVKVLVDEAGLPGYVQRVWPDPDVAGLLVTTPLKRAILVHLDRLSDIVKLTGAANCVRFDAGVWTGVNIDGIGFSEALSKVAAARALKTALLVGCGGAGSAIAASLVAGPVRQLALFDIDPAKARDLRRRLRQFAPHVPITEARSPEGTFDLVVNASTAGMDADDASPINDATMAAAGVVADILTDSGTAMKKRARELGKPLVEGKAMVAAQIALMRRFFTSDAASEADLR